METNNNTIEYFDNQFKKLFRSEIEIFVKREDGSCQPLHSGEFIIHRFTPGNIELVMATGKPINLPFPFNAQETTEGLEFSYKLEAMFEPSPSRSSFVSKHARHSHKFLHNLILIKTKCHKK